MPPHTMASLESRIQQCMLADQGRFMRRLRRLFNRSRLDERELNMMRGILTALAPAPVRATGAKGPAASTLRKPSDTGEGG